MNDTNNLIVEDNLGLVRLCANRFRGKGIEYDDLYSAGCIGLLKAAKAFDFNRGVKFSTYAVPVILGEIKRLFRDGGSIKVSRSMKELSLKIVKERERCIKKEGREPSLLELAELLDTDVESIVEALNTSQPVLSLTESVDENGSQIDVPIEAPDLEITDLLSLRQIIGELSDVDRKLIALRYFKEKTQTQTAKELGMTQVQVSRREKKLLYMMKEKLIV